MKHSISILSLLALAGSASAAVVTNGFVANKAGQNWSHLPGAVASQKTDGSGGLAPRGIDGTYNGAWSGNSVTHTNGTDTANWWQVDLGAARPIADITLFNRTDCCANRLSNYSVLASNDPTFTAPHIYDSGNVATAPVGTSVGFAPGGVTAQYVRVQRDGTNLRNDQVISLAEVDVIGAYKNLATGSTPSQSSDWGASAAADSAIDGNLNTSFGSGSTTHTAGGGATPVFWETVLEVRSNINEISLYNRGDCCQDRLSNFRVSVFDGSSEVWGQDYFTTTGNAGNIFSILEDTGGFFATGDRVRVELIGGTNNGAHGTDILSLREVEIYGVPEPSSTFALVGLSGLGLILRRKRK